LETWRKIHSGKNYLERTGDILLPKDESGSINLFDMVEYGRNESNEEIHKYIEDIVNKRLKEYNLF
jgi:hypothetical protein